jgi:hypothetical protein
MGMTQTSVDDSLSLDFNQVSAFSSQGSVGSGSLPPLPLGSGALAAKQTIRGAFEKKLTKQQQQQQQQQQRKLRAERGYGDPNGGAYADPLDPSVEPGYSRGGLALLQVRL